MIRHKKMSRVAKADPEKYERCKSMMVNLIKSDPTGAQDVVNEIINNLPLLTSRVTIYTDPKAVSKYICDGADEFVEYYKDLAEKTCSQHKFVTLFDPCAFGSLTDEIEHIGEDDRYVYGFYESRDELLDDLDDDWCEKWIDESKEQLRACSTDAEFCDIINEAWDDAAYNGSDEHIVCKDCETYEFTIERQSDELEWLKKSIDDEKTYLVGNGPTLGMGTTFESFSTEEELADYLIRNANDEDLDKIIAQLGEQGVTASRSIRHRLLRHARSRR